MENKVVLYNSNDIKIGETFVRRAKQLVNRQRAQWTDSSQTAIRFYPEMEHMDEDVIDPIATPSIQIHQLCFAPWPDGYYYPAVIEDVLIDHVRIAFLDCDKRTLRAEQVIGLQDAFDNMAFEGNWQDGWRYYEGILTSRQPLVMTYYDGDVEHINLYQLRCFFPK